MAVRYCLCLVACRLRHGWEAYLHSHKVSISVGRDPLPTQEDAKASLLDALQTHFARPKNHYAPGVTLDEPHSLEECEIRWFDPAKHFRHCDTAYLTESREFVTFLGYEDGRARVMLTNGCETLLVQTEAMKPMNLSHSW